MNQPELNKSLIDKIIGANIRRERSVRKLSRDELAGVLGLTTSHLGLIERGERGATNLVLHKLKNAFDLPIDSFFAEGDDHPSSRSQRKTGAYRKRVDTLVDTLNETELEMLSYTIKGLLVMRKPE